MRLVIGGGEPAEDSAPASKGHGSAVEAVGEEIIGLAADIPWDTYLGPGAAAAVGDGSLGVVRHAYPATAAADMRAVATATGVLHGDAAAQERVAAIGLRIAAARHRPARMPHPPGEEPHAWWIEAERTLVWLPWAGLEDAPYGFRLLESGEADSVVVLGPDAVWTVFTAGIPRRGTKGGWDALPQRLRRAVAEEVGTASATVRWRREADSVVIRWRQDGVLKTATIEVNRLHRARW